MLYPVVFKLRPCVVLNCLVVQLVSLTPEQVGHLEPLNWVELLIQFRNGIIQYLIVYLIPGTRLAHI